MDILSSAAKYYPALTCVFAFLSAIAWTRSATVRVPFSMRNSKGEPRHDLDIGEDKKGRFHLQETLHKQAYWNRAAAGLGAAAAMFQAIQVFGV